MSSWLCSFNRFSFSTKVYLLFNCFSFRLPRLSLWQTQFKTLSLVSFYQYVKELKTDLSISVVKSADLNRLSYSFSTSSKNCCLSAKSLFQSFQSTFCFFVHLRQGFGGWKWRISESNRWPPACKAGALASWANPPVFLNLLKNPQLAISAEPRLDCWANPPVFY